MKSYTITITFLFEFLFAYAAWTKPRATWGSCYLHTYIMKPLYCAICVIASNHWLKTWPLAITVVSLLIVSTNIKFSCNKFWQKNVKEVVSTFAAYFCKTCDLLVLLLSLYYFLWESG